MAELETLMLRYQQADATATTALIRQISPLLFRYFANQEGSRIEAEDMLQITWLQIHKVRHTYRPGEPLLPWVYAIARHVRIDAYRRAQRIRVHERRTDPLPEAGAALPHALAEPPDFGSLISALPDSQREVVTMLKSSDMTLEEVARATGCSVGSVKLKAHRAYAKLRTILAREHKPGQGKTADSSSLPKPERSDADVV